jgi:signal transduction histidine kinase
MLAPFVGVPLALLAAGGLLWVFGGVVLATFTALTFSMIRCRLQARACESMDLARHEFSRRLMSSQEQERKRIAQELHDCLGQDLLLIKTSAQMAAASEQLDPRAYERLTLIISLASKAVGNVRSITGNLRPPELDRLGLAAAIEAMADNVSESSKLDVQCGVEHVDHQVPKADEINLYRIVQECLSNAIKHSNASHVRIQSHRVNGTLDLSVSDDGRGFDPSDHLGGGVSSGMGLVGMSERTRSLGGRLSIESAPGRGARVSLSIPVHDHER